MKLSIVVPVYNLERYIARTLDSLLAIRFSYDYEIIVVNDGSTDASETVIREYQKKTDRIRLFTIENGGVSNARNIGVRQAAGEYITFVDGDDTVEPDFYETAVAELDQGGYDFVQGNYRKIYGDHTEDMECVKRDVVLTDRKEMLAQYYCFNRGYIHAGVWAKVYQAEFVRRIPANRKWNNAEDLEHNFRILCECDRVKLLKDICINYYQREDSAVHTLNVEKERQALAVLDQMLEMNPYRELDWMLHRQRLLYLQGRYCCLCRERNPQVGTVRDVILRIPFRQVWPHLTKEERKWVLLHRFAGPLYDFYIRRTKGTA